MVEDFVAHLEETVELRPEEASVLRASGVRSYDGLDALTRCYPSIHTLGVRVPWLSSLASRRLSARYRAEAAAMSDGRPIRRANATSGAKHPNGARWPPGAIVPKPVRVARSSAARVATLAPIDLRRANWPVRDQGDRGTCVAFGAAAALELSILGTQNGTPPDMSEQFLYWAIKTGTRDPDPGIDGSLLEFAHEALGSIGICTEGHWPYNGMVIPGNVSHGGSGSPTPAARKDATGHVLNSTHFQMLNGSGGVAAVLGALQNGRAAAITLPVFSDPTMPGGADNWNTALALAYGDVLDPPPTASQVGGHAVCVVGFVPDAMEANGGFFIVRNSWDTGWAQNAPSPGNGYSPAPGYGTISAQYVENFLWEILVP